jgi:hypothetical protein
LKKNDISILSRGVTFNVNTALPDTLEAFINNFIDVGNGNIINGEKFKRRIIGLTSYFKSAQEELLPKYDKTFDRIVVEVPMSDYQFGIYDAARQSERQSEKKKNGKAQKIDKDGLFISPTSTYKIFSRLFCNFVMPQPPGRPIPSEIRSMNQVNFAENFLEKRNNERKQEVQENIKLYIESLPPDFRDNEKMAIPSIERN